MIKKPILMVVQCEDVFNIDIFLNNFIDIWL